MRYFLKDSPVKIEVYESITQTKTYPLPYCQTRWCKNEPVAERAAEIWPVYCKFIQHLASLPKSKQPQNNKSFDGLLLAVSNPLICAKFKFFESISWKLNTFLRGFQTDKPMVPFLFLTLEDLLRWLMKISILRETLEKVDSVKKLLKIDPLNVNTHKPPSNIDVGFAARALVLEYNRKVSHKVSNVLKFQKGVLALLSNLSSHFIEKSPLKSAIVRYAQCFDPVIMESNRCDAEKNNLLFFCKSCSHLKDYHLLRLQSRLKSNLELF